MPRVLLRPIEESDVDRVHQLLSQEAVVRYTLFPLFTEARAQEFVRWSMAEREKEDPSQEILAIVHREEDRLVGLCGLVLKPMFEEAEAWYLLDPAYWGQGLMSEAVRLLLDIGFSELGLHRIWATCMPENPASARVLEKAGLRREGFLKENLKIHGVWRDTFLYAILHREWERQARQPGTAPLEP
jgi:RimJ/RimL family protein N-acetyltransferase